MTAKRRGREQELRARVTHTAKPVRRPAAPQGGFAKHAATSATLHIAIPILDPTECIDVTQDKVSGLPASHHVHLEKV